MNMSFMIHSSSINITFFLISTFILLSCSRKEVQDDTLFEMISPEVTNIDFVNTLSFDPDFNIYRYRNFYNGGGVAIGDISGNGLPDIFLTGNMVPNRLYLNKGNFEFEDVTEQAGVAGMMEWATGVSFVDINGNGLLDIYITNAGLVNEEKRRNELYINNGDLTFSERAAEFGLDDPGFGVHAVFFDYNGNGRLDMYLLNNSNTAISNFDLEDNLREVRDGLAGDKLFRNEGDYFVDVSEEAGIYGSEIGLSLSASVADINRSGWLDIYVANDFFERDYLYLNNGDGTFREVQGEQMQSISAASMGSDIGDLSNNGWPDIYVSDMLPKSNRRLKTMTTFEGWELYQDKVDFGYGHQFTRNTLQVNMGNETFSEAGRLTGTEATDWSWAALIADYDNNGYNDIFVTNGLVQDITNLDYLGEIREPDMVRSIVTGEGTDYEKLIDIVPSEPVGNVVFSGEGNLEFIDRSDEWGLGTPGFSSGAAWGDLNGDGSLDLVVNDVNGPVRIYRNRVAERHPDRNWLRIDLLGEAPNTQAIGSQLQVWAGGELRYREHMLQRGFQSSMEPGLHVGLGETTAIDSLVLRWPDGRTSRVENLDVPARITLRQSEATDRPAPPPRPATMPGDFAFEDLKALSECELCKRPETEANENSGSGSSTNIPDADRNAKKRTLPGRPLLQPTQLPPLTDHSHQRYDYSDFGRERLLLHMRSTEGPALCTGDINGDGLDDVYIGGARGQAGTLWKQGEDGTFSDHQPDLFTRDAGSEDIDCVFFDATGNGLDDLYVVSGGNSFSTSSSLLADRLYLADSAGQYSRSGQLLPTFRGFESGSVVVATDFTGDENVDLFVGTRLRSFAVGLPANGYLLAGNGDGTFTDVTEEWAPGLLEAGMITDALWADLTGDGSKELVIVGEWMPVRVYANRGDRLEEITGKLGLENTSGWWNSIAAADINGDGRLDLIGANHGENSMFRASPEAPVRMWVGDFAGNGVLEQVLSYPKDETDYPVALRHDLIAEIPQLAEKYPDYASYGGQSVQQIFLAEVLSNALELRATELRSMIYWNREGGFIGEPLPMRAQLAPMYGVHLADLTGDGVDEILMGGNHFNVKPQAGPYDASRGVVIGYKNAKLGSYPPQVSGMNLPGEIREIKEVITSNGTRMILIAKNDGKPKLLKIGEPLIKN